MSGASGSSTTGTGKVDKPGSFKLHHLVLLLAHLGIAAAAVVYMADYRAQRQTAVDAVRTQALAERSEVEAFATQVAAEEALRQGLRQDDPYVVELLLRQRLGWQTEAQEVRPPLANDTE